MERILGGSLKPKQQETEVTINVTQNGYIVRMPVDITRRAELCSLSDMHVFATFEALTEALETMLKSPPFPQE
jgi:hypothetical protein